MIHGSLFSGIGGFDLAAEWMGWDNIFHCEWNPFCQRVLKYQFPNSISYNDITNTDFTIHRGTIDVLSGGFPCQPYSLAGKRKGKEDDRHLWPEMLRAIREISPAFVVGENVYGLVNWNGGLVFDEVQADLENEGYEVTAVILPACGQNAPHKRERIWFVAKNNNKNGWRSEQRKEKSDKRKQWDISTGNNEQLCTDNAKTCDATNNDGDGQQQRNSKHEINTSEGGQYAQRDIEQFTLHTNSTGRDGQHISQKRKRQFNRSDSRDGINTWQDFPTESPICGGDDGLPRELDGITFSKWRNESIKAYGNAVVPQIPYQIFKAIQQYVNQTK